MPTVTQQALAILRRPGITANVYTAGLGAINALQAGNFLDAGTTPAAVDGTVQQVNDGVGAITASQSTAGNRPTLRRGALNLLAYSNDLTNAAWAASNGSVTATRFLPDATNSIHRVQRLASYATTVGVAYSYAVLAKADGYRYLYVNGAASPNVGQVCFDLLAGTVAQTGNGVGTIAAIGDGSYLCVVSATATLTSSSPFMQVNNTGVATDTTFAADGTSAMFLYARGAFTGTLTAAQILAEGGIPLTTSAAASNPAAGRYSLEFATSKSLALASVPFQMADDHAVICAFTVGASGATSSVFDIRNTASNNAIVSKVGLNVGAVVAQWRDDAATLVSLSGTSPAVGQSIVVSSLKRGNNKYLRVNGVQVSTDATVMGATTVTGSGIGYSPIGVPSNYFTGNISQVLPLKGTFTDAEMLVLERAAASTLPNAPVF